MYEFCSDDKYKTLNIKDSFDVSLLDDINKLTTVRLELEDSEDEDRKKKLSDFPGFYSRGVLMSERAKSILELHFRGCGSWVEMKYETATLYYFFVDRYLAAINPEKTQFFVFQNQVVDILNKVLKNIDYSEYGIFKLEEYPKLFPIINESVYKAIKVNKLTGLKFSKLEVA